LEEENREDSHLLFQTEEQAQHKGFQLNKELTEDHTDPDALCSYATCLNDGEAGLLRYR